MDIDLVVLHSISLPPGEHGGDAVERLFTNRLDWGAHPYYGGIRGLRVSAHFFIRRDGDVVQFVSCRHRAWHAGQSVWRGRDRCNDYAIGVEMEGLEHHPFDDRQYGALTRLLPDLATRYPIRSIAGHEHVAPGRKQDPGRAFEWAVVERAVSGLAIAVAGSDGGSGSSV